MKFLIFVFLGIFASANAQVDLPSLVIGTEGSASFDLYEEQVITAHTNENPANIPGVYPESENRILYVGDDYVVTSQNDTILVPEGVNDVFELPSGFTFIAPTGVGLRVYQNTNLITEAAFGDVTFLTVSEQDNLLLAYVPLVNSFRGIHFDNSEVQILLQLPKDYNVTSIHFSREVTRQVLSNQAQNLPQPVTAFEAEGTVDVIYQGIPWTVFLSPEQYRNRTVTAELADYTWGSDLGLWGKDSTFGDDIHKIEMSVDLDYLDLTSQAVFPFAVDEAYGGGRGQYYEFSFDLESEQLRLSYRGFNGSSSQSGEAYNFLRTFTGEYLYSMVYDQNIASNKPLQVLDPGTKEVLWMYGATEDGHFEVPDPGNPDHVIGAVRNDGYVSSITGQEFFSHDYAVFDYGGNVVRSARFPEDVEGNCSYEISFALYGVGEDDIPHNNGSDKAVFREGSENGLVIVSSKHNLQYPLLPYFDDVENDTIIFLRDLAVMLRDSLGTLGNHNPLFWTDYFEEDSTAVFYCLDNNDSWCTGERSAVAVARIKFHDLDAKTFSVHPRKRYGCGISNAQGSASIIPLMGEQIVFANSGGHPNRSNFTDNTQMALFKASDDFREGIEFARINITSVLVPDLPSGVYQASFFSKDKLPQIDQSQFLVEETETSYTVTFTGVLPGEWFWQESNISYTEPLVIPKDSITGREVLIFLSGKYPGAVDRVDMCGRSVINGPMMGNVVSSVTTSNTSSYDLDVYPNPVIEQLFVEYNTTTFTAYSIYNTLGSLIQQGRFFSPTTEIDVSSLSAGTYIIRTADSAATFIKQ